jgi:hypothetical protein
MDDVVAFLSGVFVAMTIWLIVALSTGSTTSDTEAIVIEVLEGRRGAEKITLPNGEETWVHWVNKED